MTAHSFHKYDLATTDGMTYDEVFPMNSPPKEDAAVTECASRLDASSCGDPESDVPVPALVPISPCLSDETSMVSITGRFENIEERYRVDPRVLGSGLHGSVRECVDRCTGRRHAVKSVRKADPDVRPTVLAREISLLREMRHDNVVRLRGVAEDEEYVHIVTDLYEGGELFDRIVERSEDDNNDALCCSEEEAANIMRQILEAIAYMHGRGVVHRDIKPENILFKTSDADSQIVLVDFGLARKHDPKRQPSMNSVVGTPYYIAPEVLRRRYDRSCDLWSAGVIAHVLLCGYPPFNGADNSEVHAAIKRGRYRFHASEWRGISVEAKDFVRRLLQKDRRKRMSVEEAMEHPWIANRGRSSMVVARDDNVEDDWSVEVVFGGMTMEDSIICGGERNG